MKKICDCSKKEEKFSTHIFSFSEKKRKQKYKSNHDQTT